MKTIYLPIRAFGDFIITASVIKNNFTCKVPIILPSYLNNIYQAINGDQYFQIIDNFQISNQPAFFELYKVRDLENIKRLINDIHVVSAVLNKNKKDRYILDYSSKRLFFTGANFLWPLPHENIYDGKLRLFTEYDLITPRDKAVDILKPVATEKMTRILILPDSRIKSKSISADLVALLIKKLGNEVQVAEFSTDSNTKKNNLQYANFSELMALLMSFDLVISAESLPYHLANYLNKPHFVIYNKSRHFKSTFMTPFMLKNKCYSTFTGLNAEEVVSDINTVLSGGTINNNIFDN